MEKHEIASARLLNQQISASNGTSPSESVKWLGAMQAQDAAMALWAIGLRTFNSTISSVRKACDQGEIIRTHLMRPTWHYVSADDIYWMLELTAPQIKNSLKTRHKQLGITDDILNKVKDIFTEYLMRNGASPREELVSQLEEAGIPNKDNRAAHLLMHAELDGIICSGPMKGNKQTYALLEERVPKKKKLPYQEALAELAMRYFSSHGPATSDDFAWWSGLRAKHVKLALELVKQQLQSVIIDSQEYWFSSNTQFSKTNHQLVHLLPAFDEFIVSYRDRSAILTSEHHKKAVSRNGLFWPVIVVNGKVEGLWKRTIKNNLVQIEIHPFHSISSFTLEQIKEQAELYGKFLGKKNVVKQISHG